MDRSLVDIPTGGPFTFLFRERGKKKNFGITDDVYWNDGDPIIWGLRWKRVYIHSQIQSVKKSRIERRRRVDDWNPKPLANSPNHQRETTQLLRRYSHWNEFDWLTGRSKVNKTEQNHWRNKQWLVFVVPSKHHTHTHTPVVYRRIF